VTTVNGADVDVTASAEGVLVNGASVIRADIIASDGIVHVIDKVLLPPDLEAKAAALTAEATQTTAGAAETTEPTDAPGETTEITQAAQTTADSTDPPVAGTTASATDDEPAAATTATDAPESADAPASTETPEAPAWGSGEHAIFAGKSSKEAKKGKQAKLFKPAGAADGPEGTSESGKAKSSKLFAPHIASKSEKEGKSSKGLFAKASGGHSTEHEAGAESAEPHSTSSKSSKEPVDGVSIAAALGKATKEKQLAGGKAKAVKDETGMSSWR